jgi:NAD+ synthase (glutamine-hydrolysing)
LKVNRIALGQINTTVGDFGYNVGKIVDFARRAETQGAQLVCFPELSVCGYPPQDLVERPAFMRANERALREIAKRVDNIDVVVGYVENNLSQIGKPAFNAAAWISGGEVVSRHYKSLLPSYDVFNENRYFEEGSVVIPAGPEGDCAVTICEDIWNEAGYENKYSQVTYARHPLEEAAAFNPEFVINISASPFIRGKDRYRNKFFKFLARKYAVPLIVCNQVGGNDSLIFDGNSTVINASGEVLAKANAFEEQLLVVDLDGKTSEPVFPEEVESVYEALKLGLKDYLDKCGFENVVLGLSGGIDSSLTASIAVDALGKERVLGLMLPTDISSEESVIHARKLAANLGVETKVIHIQNLFDGYLDLLAEDFAGTGWDTTEENLQARIRGNILMAFSNKYNRMLLASGNKSELAVGYCTLYGDMTGGMGVISDVPKTMVYELAGYCNRSGEVIPSEIIEKPPAAELSPGQVDQDDLPSYEILDEIIERYVELNQTPEEIIEKGLDPIVVEDVVHRIDYNEYKRQQSPVGLKVTSKSFGAGRAMPIAQRFEP